MTGIVSKTYTILCSDDKKEWEEIVKVEMKIQPQPFLYGIRKVRKDKDGWNGTVDGDML